MRSSSLPAFTAAPNCFKILPSSLLYPGMSSSLCNHGIDTHGHRAACRYSPSRHETTGETSKNPFGIFHHFIDHFARFHLQCLSNLHKQIQTRRSITKLQGGYVAFRNANPICKFLLREPRRITVAPDHCGHTRLSQLVLFIFRFHSSQIQCPFTKPTYYCSSFDYQ